MARKISIAGILAFFAIAGFVFGYNLPQAQSGSNGAAQAASPAKDARSPRIPAYHAHPPNGALPATIDPNEFGDAETRNLYSMAGKIKRVLYQEPCYCGCDREAGHKSLLDCYVDHHAAGCDVCKKEAAYAYLQTKQGKSPAQIRRGIVNGAWSAVDLSAYDSPEPSK